MNRARAGRGRICLEALILFPQRSRVLRMTEKEVSKSLHFKFLDEKIFFKYFLIACKKCLPSGRLGKMLGIGGL
jgi:hypothetical protein